MPEQRTTGSVDPAASPSSPKAKTVVKGTSATLSVPDVSDMNVMDAALAYAEAGWFVGPLRHREKNPGGVLGKEWETKSSRDPAVIGGWFAEHPDRGVFVHCGRSGAVTFDVDHPSALHPLLSKAFDAERPPNQSTRPNDPRRGHYLFRQPPGRDVGNSLGTLGKGWGEVRGRNGVIVVAPSEHEKDDGRYMWEQSGPVPVLPDYVADQLPDALDAASAVTGAEVSAFLVDYLDGERTDLLGMHVQSWLAKVKRGDSRHDAMTGHLTGAMKEAAAGLYPAALAADTLESIFVQAVREAGHGEQGAARSDAEAGEEWRALLSWAVGQAKAADPVETLERAGQLRSSAAADFAFSDFFDQTEVLQHIRAAAHSRLLSAPMLLMQVLARVLLEVPPGWLLPAVVGSPASLNVGFAVVGLSSAGKSSSLNVAGELLGLDQETMIKGIGSGEGMIDAFFDVIKIEGKNTPQLKTKPHILLTVDEVETLQKLLDRSGSTTGSLLRTALTGGTLSTTNAAASGRSRHLPQLVYRLVTIVAVQPALSGVLLDGENAGLPQRFLWFGGKDSSLPPIADLPDWPGALSWDLWSDLHLEFGPRHRTIEYPDHVKGEVRQAQHDGQSREDADPLKGHLMLTRLKIAAALAFLHQELDIRDQWWELAGVLSDASVQVQEYCRTVLTAEAAKRSDQKARQAGRSKVVENTATEVELARRKSVSENIMTKVTAAGAVGVRRGQLRNTFHDRDRTTFDHVAELLVESGQIRSEEIEKNGRVVGTRLYRR